MASINSADRMRTADLSSLAAQLDGVAERRGSGLLEWRYRGRLVARQLDHSHVVIRASFDFREFLLRSFPVVRQPDAAGLDGDTEWALRGHRHERYFQLPLAHATNRTPASLDGPSDDSSVGVW